MFHMGVNDHQVIWLPGFDIVCQSILQVLLVFISRELDLSIISDSTFRISKECALAKRYIDSNYAQNITLERSLTVNGRVPVHC